MNSNYSFSYIIAYRHNAERLQNLRRVLDWVNGFHGVEVIVVEQDKHSKISHLNLKAKLIFTKSNMPFNKSLAFNVGLKYSTSEIIVFGDSDLIMEPNDFINGLKSLSEFEMCNPYHTVIDLTHQESNMQLGDMIRIDRPGRGETDIQKVPLCGGICIFRRESIMRLGGWNEDFIGWGGEDDFQSLKVKNFLNWTELKAKCFHLFHNRVQPDIKWYQRNLQLLNQSTQLSKEQLQKVIHNQMPKMGMKNKYDTF